MSQQRSPEQKFFEEVRDLLTSFIGLYRMVNAKQIQEAKAEILKNVVRKKVYDLCDGTKTVKEIAQTVDPTKPLPTMQPLVSYHLSALESNGLVSHRDDKGQRFYYRTLE